MTVVTTSLVHGSQPSCDKVGVNTVEKAVNALLKWQGAKSQNEKAQLLEQEDFMYLYLTLKKIPPKSRTNAHKIPLPHSLHSGSELCLIIDDRPKSNQTSELAEEKIKSEDIPISKVIEFSKLKTDYKPFEAKRKLCDSYDMFFADKSVIPLLPRLLGKHFFAKKKIPVPVNLAHKNWKEQIERACSSAMLYLRTGTCSVMRVGKASMEGEEIVENVVKTIEGILGVVPKKWEGIRSLHLKFTESVALPIYQAVPDMKMKIEGKRKFDEIVAEESAGDEKMDTDKSGSIRKKKKTKGRIHEVKYMDGDVGAIGDELENEAGEQEESLGEKKGEDKTKANEDVGKKRKKDEKVDTVAKKLKDGAKKNEAGEKKGEDKTKANEDVGKKRKKDEKVDTVAKKLKDGAKKNEAGEKKGEDKTEANEDVGKKRKKDEKVDTVAKKLKDGAKKNEAGEQEGNLTEKKGKDKKKASKDVSTKRKDGKVEIAAKKLKDGAKDGTVETGAKKLKTEPRRSSSRRVLKTW